MNENAFARVLRSFRATAGLSQEELAFRAGLHRTYVSQLERGIKSPSLKTAMRLSEVLGISFSDFAKAMEETDA